MTDRPPTTPLSADVVSFERVVSLEFIRSSGGFAVKAIKGQKEPAKGWDPRLNNAAKSAQLIAELERTDDNVGLHLHGDLIDVDVDGENAEDFLIPALDYFLPPCPHTWGRKSRPRTHRVYLIKSDGKFDPGFYPLLGRLQRIKQIKVEVRGGPSSRGEYSLMPGSIHPSGETYQWADIARARSTPAVVEIDDVMKAIRMAGAVTMLAPFWTEGIRQDLTMCLAGFLHRALATGEALGGNLFFLSKEDAEFLLDGLLTIAGDDPSDRGARFKAFHKTWDKAEKGLPVVGATRMAEILGQDNIVKFLYILLSDNPNMEVVDQFTSRFAIWKGPALAVDLELAAKGHPRPFMARQNFASSYGHCFIEIDGKRKLLPEMLWGMKSAIRVDGLSFDPSQGQIVTDKDGDKINQWTGFAIPPSDKPVATDEVTPFLQYIRDVISKTDTDVYHWIMSWIASIFKNPSKKPGTALVLVGIEGAGKSILGHRVLGPIIGTAHYVATNSVENVVRNFNASYVNRLLIQCDEATNSRQRQIAARLKSFITDPMQQVEPKGVDSYHVPNHSRLLFTSNDVDDAVYMNSGVDDRRYTVVEVSAAWASGKQDYWSRLVKWLELPETLPRIHRYLLDYDIDFTLITRPLVTAAKRRMMQSSWDPFDGWLASMISRGFPLADKVQTQPYHAFTEYNPRRIERGAWPTWIHGPTLLDDYKDYVRRNDVRDAAHLTEAHVRLAFIKKKLLVEDKAMRITYEYLDEKTGITLALRPRVQTTPDHDRINHYLQVKHGFDAAFPDDTPDLDVPEPHYLKKEI